MGDGFRDPTEPRERRVPVLLLARSKEATLFFQGRSGSPRAGDLDRPEATPATERQQAMCRIVLGLTAFVCLLTACALPDTSPFVSATAQARAAIAGTGAAAEDALRAVDPQSAGKMREAWVKRNDAMTAMAAYAGSLDAIVAGGGRGADSVDEVLESVASFASAIGFDIPQGNAAVSVANDGLKFVAAVIARARALDDLEDALTATQPAIETLAQLLKSDLKDVAGILRATEQLTKTAISTSDEYKNVDARSKELSGFIASVDPRTATLRDLKRAAALQDLQGAIEKKREQREARLEINRKRTRIALALVRESDRIIETWAATHRDLAIAVRENRAMDVTSLIHAAHEVRELIRRLNQL